MPIQASKLQLFNDSDKVVLDTDSGSLKFVDKVTSVEKDFKVHKLYYVPENKPLQTKLDEMTAARVAGDAAEASARAAAVDAINTTLGAGLLTGNTYLTHDFFSGPDYSGTPDFKIGDLSNRAIMQSSSGSSFTDVVERLANMDGAIKHVADTLKAFEDVVGEAFGGYDENGEQAYATVHARLTAIETAAAQEVKARTDLLGEHVTRTGSVSDGEEHSTVAARLTAIEGDVTDEAKARTDGDEAINTLLGTGVKGTAASVAARLTAIEDDLADGDAALQSAIDAETKAREDLLGEHVTRAGSTVDGLQHSTVAARLAAIETTTANILGNTPPEALNSLAEIVTEFQRVDSDMSSAITGLSGAAHTGRLALDGRITAEAGRVTANHDRLEQVIDMLVETFGVAKAEFGAAAAAASITVVDPTAPDSDPALPITPVA